MAIKTMTIKEINREFMKMDSRDRELERKAMKRPPNLDDPDALPVSADMAVFATRPGRKNPTMKKVLTPIRLDPDVATALKSTGRNWTTRANDILRYSLRIHGLL